MGRLQNIIAIVIVSILCATNVSANIKTEKSSNELPAATEKERIVLISTEFGDIKIKLYNETPLHRDNFIKLISEHFYDSLSFHRIINGFMIQGGDPKSKNGGNGQALGNSGPGYTIPAEFNPKLFHKKGVLAAAREGDQVNPEKRSSGSQFYIVQGKVYKPQELDVMQDRMNEGSKVDLIRAYILKPENAALKAELEACQKAKDQEALKKIIDDIELKTKEDYDKVEKFSFSKEQREAYTTVGGTPHLDGGYTVYGEVIEGLEVIDKIAAVETQTGDVPVKPVIFSITLLN